MSNIQFSFLGILFYYNFSKRFGHIRFGVFGPGLCWKINKLFSERNGYKKYFQIGKWIITYIPFERRTYFQT